MRHQQYFAVPFLPDNGQGRVKVSKIFRQAFAEKRILVRQDRTSVLAEIRGIKIVSVSIHAVAQLLLEEVVVISVYIQDSLFGFRKLRLFDECTDNFSLVIIRHLNGPAQVAIAQHVRNVLGINCRDEEQ